MTEQRVKWVCGAEGCSKGVHYGTAAIMPHTQAARQGLTADPPGEVGVAFDDRLGVIQYHSWAELEPVSAGWGERTQK